MCPALPRFGILCLVYIAVKYKRWVGAWELLALFFMAIFNSLCFMVGAKTLRGFRRTFEMNLYTMLAMVRASELFESDLVPVADHVAPPGRAMGT